MSTARAVVNPATEETIATINQVDAEAADEAIARAAAAFPAWRAVAPVDRARLLRRFSEAVGAANEELARLEVANSGHTISNARWEAGNVRDVLAYYAGAPERLFGRQIPVPGGVDVTFREPIGVVGIIVPWNFPMPIASWGFAPALAAGNTVVLKPADLTPSDGDPHRRACPRSGHPRARLPGPARQGLGRRLALCHQSGCRQDLLHGLDRGRPEDHGGLFRAGEAADPRARRQECQHRLRRRRPRGCGCSRAVRGLRQRRPGLLRAFTHPRAGKRLRALHGALRDSGQEGAGHRPLR